MPTTSTSDESVARLTRQIKSLQDAKPRSHKSFNNCPPCWPRRCRPLSRCPICMCRFCGAPSTRLVFYAPPGALWHSFACRVLSPSACGYDDVAPHRHCRGLYHRGSAGARLFCCVLRQCVGPAGPFILRGCWILKRLQACHCDRATCLVDIEAACGHALSMLKRLRACAIPPSVLWLSGLLCLAIPMKSPASTSLCLIKLACWMSSSLRACTVGH